MAYLFIPTSESPNKNHLLCEEMYIYILSPSSLQQKAPGKCSWHKAICHKTLTYLPCSILSAEVIKCKLNFW